MARSSRIRSGSDSILCCSSSNCCDPLYAAVSRCRGSTGQSGSRERHGTFNDVPTGHPFFQYIEALSASGVTGGCNAAPPLYCPDNFVTRGQMAVFLAKALGL